MGIAALYNDLLLDQLIFCTGVEQRNLGSERGHYTGVLGRHQAKADRAGSERGAKGVPYCTVSVLTPYRGYAILSLR